MKNGASQQWFDDVVEFSSYKNVYCKLSGKAKLLYYFVYLKEILDFGISLTENS